MHELNILSPCSQARFFSTRQLIYKSRAKLKSTILVQIHLYQTPVQPETFIYLKKEHFIYIRTHTLLSLGSDFGICVAQKQLEQTTRVVFLYPVLLGIASCTEQNLTLQSRLHRVEYFCYSEQVIRSRIFLTLESFSEKTLSSSVFLKIQCSQPPCLNIFVSPMYKHSQLI